MCGTGGVGVQKCPGLPFTSLLTFILLAPLLLLSCDETDGLQLPSLLFSKLLSNISIYVPSIGLLHYLF